MSLGPSAWAEARACIKRLLSARESILRDNRPLRDRTLILQSHVHMHLPATIGDYTDFFCSLEHAQNCGMIFRGRDNPLQPNWKHMPVAYHGRSSSIVVSGTDVYRPWGQTSLGTFQPSERVDFELEMVQIYLLSCLVLSFIYPSLY